MTAIDLPSPAPARPILVEPLFTAAGVLMAALMLPTLTAMALDPRLFQGDSVWLKPAKFQVALSIYLLTLAVFARWLPAGITARLPWRIYAGVVVAAIAAEMAWIGGAAMHGTASHFNIASPLMAALYGLMGAFAVTLTSASLVMGVAIARNPATGLPPALHLSLWLGLVLTFVLTVIVAGTMSSGTGHLVGTPVLDARVPLMGWSREVGDLRIAHFLATHAMHFVPLAGLAALALPQDTGRRAVWAAAALFTALTLATFLQALAGRPLFPLA